MLLSTTTHDFTVSIFHDLLVYEISLNTFLMDLLHKKGTHTYFQIFGAVSHNRSKQFEDRKVQLRIY